MGSVSLRGYLFFLLCPLLQACNGQEGQAACKQNYSRAIKLINANNPRKLDSALFFVNQSLGCIDRKSASVELKATILYAMQRYQEGLKFVDSMSANDFYYPYRKQLLRDNFRSMIIDSMSREVLLKAMDDKLTTYLKTHKIENTEEQDAFIDLFEIKKRYKNSSAINKEIDSLIKVQPVKRDFFEKLRITED